MNERKQSTKTIGAVVLTLAVFFGTFFLVVVVAPQACHFLDEAQHKRDMLSRRSELLRALPSDVAEVDDAYKDYSGLEGDYAYCFCARTGREALEPFAEQMGLAAYQPGPTQPGVVVDYACGSKRPACWRTPPDPKKSYVLVRGGFVTIAGWHEGILYFSSSHS